MQRSVFTTNSELDTSIKRYPIDLTDDNNNSINAGHSKTESENSDGRQVDSSDEEGHIQKIAKTSKEELSDSEGKKSKGFTPDDINSKLDQPTSTKQSSKEDQTTSTFKNKHEHLQVIKHDYKKLAKSLQFIVVKLPYSTRTWKKKPADGNALTPNLSEKDKTVEVKNKRKRERNDKKSDFGIALNLHLLEPKTFNQFGVALRKQLGVLKDNYIADPLHFSRNIAIAMRNGAYYLKFLTNDIKEQEACFSAYQTFLRMEKKSDDKTIPTSPIATIAAPNSPIATIAAPETAVTTTIATETHSFCLTSIDRPGSPIAMISSQELPSNSDKVSGKNVSDTGKNPPVSVVGTHNFFPTKGSANTSTTSSANNASLKTLISNFTNSKPTPLPQPKKPSDYITRPEILIDETRSDSKYYQMQINFLGQVMNVRLPTLETVRSLKSDILRSQKPSKKTFVETITVNIDDDSRKQIVTRMHHHAFKTALGFISLSNVSANNNELVIKPDVYEDFISANVRRPGPSKN